MKKAIINDKFTIIHVKYFVAASRRLGSNQLPTTPQVFHILIKKHKGYYALVLLVLLAKWDYLSRVFLTV